MSEAVTETAADWAGETVRKAFRRHLQAGRTLFAERSEAAGKAHAGVERVVSAYLKAAPEADMDTCLRDLIEICYHAAAGVALAYAAAGAAPADRARAIVPGLFGHIAMSDELGLALLRRGAMEGAAPAPAPIPARKPETAAK